MTLPDERYRAVIAAERMLRDLCDPKATPRVHSSIRDRARAVLRHYPSQWDMDRAAAAVPEVFMTHIEDLHRFILKGRADAAIREEIEARIRGLE